jgi:hypothetical protein
MANIKGMEQELLELRESTLKEFSEVDSTQMDSQKLEEWNTRNEKMSELVSKIKEAKKYEAEKADMESEVEKGKAVEPSAIHAEVKEAPTTLGQELLESKAYQSFMKDGQKNISSELKFNPAYEFKTTLTETGYPPAVTRSDLVVPTATRDPQTVLDLIDTITTDNYQYKYLEETTFTNNSAAAAEGGTLGENALAFTEKTENIRKVGAFLPVTSGTSGAGFTQTQPLFIGAGQFGGAVGQTLWGLPVVLDTTRPAGTALVGVFGGGQAIHVVARQGMEIAMSDSHDANFTKDIIVMKATVRLGLPIYRASAFCSITGL